MFCGMALAERHQQEKRRETNAQRVRSVPKPGASISDADSSLSDASSVFSVSSAQSGPNEAAPTHNTRGSTSSGSSRRSRSPKGKECGAKKLPVQET